MSREQGEFPELVRLLAIKRHEEPPPGYWDRFAGGVVARIEAEALRRSTPWWDAWLPKLTWRSGVAWANWATLAGVAILGVSFVHIVTGSPDEDGLVFSPLPLTPSFRDPRGDASALAALAARRLAHGGLNWVTAPGAAPGSEAPAEAVSLLFGAPTNDTAPVNFVFPSNGR